MVAGGTVWELMTSLFDEIPSGAALPELPHRSPAAQMRALTLIYHEDIESDITSIIRQLMVVARYTRVRDVVGARADYLQEQDYPTASGKNHMLYIVGRHEDIARLTAAFRTLRDAHGHGLRGYVTPVEEVI